MKLVRTLLLTGLGVTSLAALLLAQGCSSSSSTVSTTDGGTHKDGGNATDSGKPKTDSGKPTGDTGTDSAAAGTGEPPASSGSPTTSTAEHTFAIHHLYLGDTDPTPSYTADANAWKSLGYNIDGKTSTMTSTDVCTPYNKSSKAQQDGNNGIDNAFGGVLVPALGPLIKEVDPTAVGGMSETVTASIIGGSFTLEVDTIGFTSSPTQTNTSLTGQLFAGGAYGSTPPLTGTSFSLSDNWPVESSLLNGTTVASGSKIKFPQAYVNNGIWVSGTPVDLTLSLGIAGQTLTLTIHHAVMSFQHTVDSTGQGHAANGIISGVIVTKELINALNVMVGDIDSTSCTYLPILEPDLYEAQDLIIDSSGNVTNTSGTACNAISIGMGFDADEIQPPSTIAAGTDSAIGVPCGVDAGTKSSSSSGSGASSSSAGTSSSSAGTSSSSSSHSSSGTGSASGTGT